MFCAMPTALIDWAYRQFAEVNEKKTTPQKHHFFHLAVERLVSRLFRQTLSSIRTDRGRLYGGVRGGRQTGFKSPSPGRKEIFVKQIGISF